MIVYHHAFDLYHTVYRMVRLLIYFNRGDYIEVDRLRIWDFYLLFPEKMHEIRIQNDVKALINRFIKETSNPYEQILDNRKMFEKIKPYQLTAIKCLASFGVISMEHLADDRVYLNSKEKLIEYSKQFEQLSEKETNAIKFLTSHFYQMSLFGEDGLKSRTKLMECRYDAE